MLFVMVALVLSAVRTTDFGGRLSLPELQKGAFILREHVQTNHVLAVLVFVLACVAVNLWLPAKAVLKLSSGHLRGSEFGAIYGDAVIGFGVSQSLTGQRVLGRYDRRFESFKRAVAKYGRAGWLLARVVPLAPHILVNLAAGLTKVRLIAFTWKRTLVSLPGILIFCSAERRPLAVDLLGRF